MRWMGTTVVIMKILLRDKSPIKEAPVTVGL